MKVHSFSHLALATLAFVGGLTAGTAHADPTIVPAYAGALSIQLVGNSNGSPSQMAWGPDGRLYVRNAYQGVASFDLNATTGQLTFHADAVPNFPGIGIAFHNKEMYLTGFDIGDGNKGTIYRLTDDNNDGVYGETNQNELRVPIVTGLLTGDHDVDQLLVVGDTLYVGIGRRTINGHKGPWTSGSHDDFGGRGFWSGGIGRTYGDDAYNGTISWIKNLNNVASAAGAANATNPNETLLQRCQNDDAPFRIQADNKLIVHSAGTRNPFGFCVDNNNSLYFTNNFNRCMTQGNGLSGFGLFGDQLDSNFSKDVYDQVFKAAPGGDYGYWAANWQNKVPMLMRITPGHIVTHSITHDNLFNKGPYTIHNPANPDGLGPSASADGCGFWYNTALPSELRGNLFIVRYNTSITESAPGTHTLVYNDLVAVDVSTGKVRRIAFGFNNPLVVLADPKNAFLLVANISDGNIYSVRVQGQ